MAGRWLKTGTAVGLFGMGLWGLTGCPGKDLQELKPLSELKSEAEPVSLQREPEPALGASEGPKGVYSPATGTELWRQPSGGRNSGEEVTFGPGSAAAAAGGPWAFNTDSTGGVGDLLGLGATYGASRGPYEFGVGQAAAPVEK